MSKTLWWLAFYGALYLPVPFTWLRAAGESKAVPGSRALHVPVPFVWQHAVGESKAAAMVTRNPGYG